MGKYWRQAGVKKLARRQEVAEQIYLVKNCDRKSQEVMYEPFVALRCVTIKGCALKSLKSDHIGKEGSVRWRAEDIGGTISLQLY